MNKKFTFLMTAMAMLFAIMGPRNVAWGQTTTVTLTQSILGLTGSYTTNTEKEIDGITYVYTDLMKSSDNIQAKASSGTIRNKTAYSGDIISVAITHSGTARATTILGSSDGTNFSQVATGSGSITADFSNKGYKYFKITRGSNAAYWTKIEITYSTGSSTDPSITVNPTTITWNDSPINVGLTDTISVSQANLTDDITISSTIGTVTPSTIAVGEDATDVTFTYTPTTVGDFEGTITFTSGETTATVSVTGSAYDPSQVDTYTKVNSIADLTADDVFIIVGNNGSNYAMSNNNGTSSAPTAVAVTVTDDDVITNPANTILWTISGNATDGYTFYPYGSTTTWLYCTDANNGLRVGNTTDSQDHRTFSIKDSYIFNNSRNRYLGIYSNSDWRSYTSINTNITGQTFAFYKKGSYTPPTVATPTFTPSAGTYTEAQDVTIACETEGASIYYTLDGSTPTNASTLYTSAIAVSETTTVKAIAYVGNEASNVASATYTIAAPLTTMDEIFAKATAVGATATDVTVTFNNWVISGVKGNNAYLTDGTKGLIIYENSHGFAVGDALSGTVACKVQLYRGAAEFTNLTATTQGISVTEGGTVTPVEMNIADLGGVNTGAVITVNDVEYTGSDIFSDGENTIKAYNTFMTLPSFTSGRQYNITGVYIQFDETKEIAPRNENDIHLIPDTEYAINLLQNDYGTISADVTTASAGQIVTLTATPIEDYHFVEWTVLDGEANDIAVNNDNQFVMPASNVEVEATFEEDEVYVITYYYNGDEFIEDMVYEGAIGELEVPSDEFLPTGFSFVGWSDSMASTTPINGTYNVTTDTDLFAIFEKASTSRSEIVTIIDGSQLTSELTSGDTEMTFDEKAIVVSAGAKLTDVSGSAENHFAEGSAILIGKKDKYIHNTTAFENITKFEVYSNKGASKNVTIGITFSDSPIAEYDTESVNTWTAKLELDDQVYDASSKLPENAKYFWYQVTNAYNSQVQFRITYGNGSSTTSRYTRVYDDVYTFAGTDLNVEGPSIIVSGYTLTVTGTMTNTNAANLIIEDGAQLVHSNADVAATLKKDVITYTNEDERTGWNMFAAPFTGTVSTSFGENYELYTYDESTHYWMDSQLDLTIGSGYLFAKPESNTTDFELAGTLQASNVNLQYNLSYTETLADGQDNVLKGFNLAGNPYPCNAYVDMDYQVLNAEGSGFINGKDIKPGDAILVQATGANQKITFSKNPLSGPNIVVDLCVSQNRGSVIDNARIRFGEGQAMNKFYLNESGTRLYIPQNGQDFAVVSTQTTTHEMPVNFKAEKNGTYTITANTENVEAEYIHLIDNMTGMDVDLLSTPSYTFSAKTSDYASRFKLVFNVKDEASASSANDFAYMSDGNLVIDNIEGEATLQIVDMMGRVLSTETVSDSYSKALNLRAGVYVLNLNGMTQKIVVR